MSTTLELPLPQLIKGRFAFADPCAGSRAVSLGGGEQALATFTDPELFARTGTCIAFTTRDGGVSAAPYDSLNLGTHVSDDPDDVAVNRARVLAAFGVLDAPLLVPAQVHGRTVAVVDDAAAHDLSSVRETIAEGCDALVVSADRVAALLCFADCVPLVLVAPGGSFAVVHAGWRGVDNNIVLAALEQLLAADGTADPAQVNVYRGPYLHAECFETGPEVSQRFIAQFGSSVLVGTDHIDMGRALDLALAAAGIDPKRIADVGSCTMCDNQNWFSYRAQGGVCGRHGAFAIRMGNASA